MWPESSTSRETVMGDPGHGGVSRLWVRPTGPAARSERPATRSASTVAAKPETASMFHRGHRRVTVRKRDGVATVGGAQPRRSVGARLMRGTSEACEERAPRCERGSDPRATRGPAAAVRGSGEPERASRLGRVVARGVERSRRSPGCIGTLRRRGCRATNRPSTTTRIGGRHRGRAATGRSTGQHGGRRSGAVGDGSIPPLEPAVARRGGWRGRSVGSQRSSLSEGNCHLAMSNSRASEPYPRRGRGSRG